MMTTLESPSIASTQPPPSPGAAIRRLQYATRLLWLAVALLLLGALYFRWDRIGHLHDPRWQFILTLIGLAVGGWLASIQARGASRFPMTARLSIAGIIASQIFYFLLVWTPGKMNPWFWRAWWVAVVLAITATHVVWLRISAPPDRRTFVRCTIACALLAGALFVLLALRANIIADPSPSHLWGLVMFSAGSAFGSIVLWMRGLKLSRRRVPLPVKIGWGAIAQIAIVALAFYAGRLTAPQPSIFELIPSPLTSMQPQELDFQLRTDLERLKVIVQGLDELSQKSRQLSIELDQRRSREARDVFTPAEEDQIRSQFMTYLAYRAALLRLVATYAGFDAVRDPNARARCMLVGYAAGTTVYRSSLDLVTRYRNTPFARRKLNEPDSQWGIPAGMFDRVQESVAGERNIEMLAEMEAFFQTHRQRWAAAEVFPKQDFLWLSGVIDRCTADIKAADFGRVVWAARFEHLLSKVRQDTYTPMYTAQSMVSTWIGDTRLVKWEPFIRHEQILQMQGALKPGDILLERRNWFLSNAFLPGFWPHSALYIGTLDELQSLGLIRREGDKWTSDYLEICLHIDQLVKNAPDGSPHTVIESVSEGVILNSLTESMHADYVAVLRPRLTSEQKAQAIQRAFAHIGKPYDFEFDFFSADKLVCTELVYRAYDGLLKFNLEKIMGRETLPALSIASLYARTRRDPARQLDFVLFLDGVPSQHIARFADEETFCASIDRPRGFNE